MNVKELETKLTPAAEQALDELVKEYKAKLLLGAGYSASDLYGDVQEISVHNIISGVEQEKPKDIKPITKETTSIYKLFMIIAIMSSVGLIFYLDSKEIFDSLNNLQQYTLVFIVATLAVYLFGDLYSILQQMIYFRKLKSDEAEDMNWSNYSIMLINIWREFELTTRNLASIDVGESNAKEPVSVLINKLQKENIISNDDVNKLRKILDIRNKILHEGSDIGRKQYEQAAKDIEEIRKKLYENF